MTDDKPDAPQPPPQPQPPQPPPPEPDYPSSFGQQVGMKGALPADLETRSRELERRDDSE